MRAARRITVIISLCFVVFGIILMTCAAGMVGFKVDKLVSDNRQKNIVELNEKFDSIEVKTGTDPVKFVPSAGTASEIEVYENDTGYYDVTVEDGTLKIIFNEKKQWYDFINIGGIGSHQVTVKIPAGSYKQITVNVGVGDIEIPEDFSAENIVAETGIGDIKAPRGKINTKINSGIGNVTVPDGEGSGKVDINTGIGDVHVSRSEKPSQPETSGSASQPAPQQSNAPSQHETSTPAGTGRR